MFVLDFINVMKYNHDDNKHIFNTSREAFYTAMTSVSTSVKALLESVTALEAKYRKKNSNINKLLNHIYEWINDEMELQMVYATKRPQIFPHTLSGSG